MYRSKYKKGDAGGDSSQSASEAAVKGIKLFLESIKKKEGPQKAVRHLGQTTIDDVMRWADDHGLDLLHHVIILNNPEAVEYLLSHGYFQAPFEPQTNQYAHLAALLGHRTALNIVLQHRKDDNRPSKNLTYSPNGAGGVQRLREVTPLEVAAEAGQISCVKQILDQCVIKEYPEVAKYPYVALACIPGSVTALNLIIKKDNPKPEDIKKAIEIALKATNAKCLEILFQQKVKTEDMFEKKNFYHMLYTFSQSATLGVDRYKRLPEVTQVLVKHKHRVNVCSPPNTYPLYSLIKNSLCVHDYVNTRHYIMCLRILIEAGADPNFDEVEHEEKLNKKGIKTVHGRMAFSSAMHCLLETVECFAEYLESKALGVRFIVQMAEVLIQSNANINRVGRIGGNQNRFGTVLHQFAKSSVKLGVDSDVFKYLLRQGADPNAKVQGKYVINTFFDSLLPELKELSVYAQPEDHTEDVNNMLALSYFMSRECVKETLRIFADSYAKNPPQQIKKYVKIAMTELQERACEVWPLKRLCRVLIWELCNRNAAVVKSLPTDIESRSYILPSI